MDPFTAMAIGQGVNAVSQIATNAMQKKTNLEMYDRQRVDALADWNRQNEYNSPKAQMSRYKDAGLNPHLIYGQTQTAQPVRSSDAKAPNYVAPSLDPSALIRITQEMGLLNAQTANIQAQTELRKQENTFKSDLNPVLLTQATEKDRILRQEFTNKQLQNQQMQQNIKKIIADTNLSVANKAKATQTISNLATTQRLLNKKIVTEDFLQEVYSGRSGLLTEQKQSNSIQRDIAQKILELKQMGLSLDMIQTALGVVIPKKGITINK